MPQLAFETFVPQLVWLAIVFLVLYVLMARVALPRIASVLEGRSQRISSDLDQAAQLKRQTDEAIASYEKALNEARAKAHEIAQETRDRLHAETERQRLEIETKLSEKIAEAETRIRATKDAALKNVRIVAADVAGAIVTQLLGEEADRAAAERAVDSELKQG
jgi:F-type H+-transporting ATPase subunit b